MSRDITIFISSRFYEFKELREKIIKEKFSKLDVGLRLNMLDDREGIADARSPAIMSIEEARNSDIFILLLGETYKEELDNEKSYTHQEYDSAIKNGLHILAFPIGDCYAPHNQKLSNHYLFREFQNAVLINKTHTTAPYTPSDYNIDEMYEKIYKSLKEFIINQLNKSIKKKRKGLQLTSKLGKSTIIGRKKELQEIDQQLNSSNTLLLINGIGGVGKSNIASYYLHSHKEQFDYYGFFEGLDGFVSELESTFKLKRELGRDSFLDILRELRELEGKKLLVIDDVKKNQEVIKQILALKDSGYQILLTSREEITDIDAYTLGILSLDNAKELFNSIFEIKDEHLLEEIVGYLDCHAFFIEMTAKSLKVNTKRTPQKVIEMFRGGKLSKIKTNKNETFNDYLNKRFSLDSLDAEDILLLKQLSLLPSIEIDFKFLTKIFGLTDEEDIEDFQDLLNFLVQKGWLIKTNKGYKLHQIIKEFIWTNHQPTLEEMDKIILFFAKLIENSDDVQSAVLLKGYLVYFEAINNVLNRVGIFNKKITKFWANLGLIYYSRGFYGEAKSLYIKVMQIREKILGEEHQCTTSIYNNLAGLYQDMGEYQKAESLYIKALKIDEKILGNKHPNTATIYHNLALHYSSMGEYQKAEPLYFKALKIYEKILGKKHPNTASIYHSLAYHYRLFEQYEKAELLYMKALEIREKILGKNHPDTAFSYNDLAKLYQLIKKYGKVESLYLKALKIIKEILGKRHPCTATSYANLAVFYYEQEDYKRAYEFMKRAVDIRSKVLPSNHPNLLNSKKNLKMIEQELSR